MEISLTLPAVPTDPVNNSIRHHIAKMRAMMASDDEQMLFTVTRCPQQINSGEPSRVDGVRSRTCARRMDGIGHVALTGIKVG